jgi:hypothetical protein
VQIDSAALKFDLVDLALAVVLAARLERQHLRVLREVLQPEPTPAGRVPAGRGLLAS